MKFYNTILVSVITFIQLNFVSAQKITISGYVKDAVAKEALIGASVVNANTKTGTTTNQYGFFSLTVPVADTIELLISFTSYSIQAKKITAKENLRMDILLESQQPILAKLLLQRERMTTTYKKRRWVLLTCL